MSDTPKFTIAPDAPIYDALYEYAAAFCLGDATGPLVRLEACIAAVVHEAVTTATDDVAAILRALGLGDHARPISAHEVVHTEIIPAIQTTQATLFSTAAKSGWLAANINNVAEVDGRYHFKGANRMRYYPTLEDLVAAEMAREREP